MASVSWSERWRGLPPALRAFIGALAGGSAAFVYGSAWVASYERALRPFSCDLGCLILIPLYAGLVLAGAAAGAWLAYRPRRVHLAAWFVAAAIGVGGLVWPKLLLAPAVLPPLLGDPTGEAGTWALFLVLSLAEAVYVLALPALVLLLSRRRNL